MARTTETTKQISRSVFGQKVADYQQLVKFRLNLTVVFSASMAFAIASEGTFSWVGLAILAAGGFLITGASNALNQVLEKDFDRMMKRTADRPIASGRMSVSEGVMAAGLMSLMGIMLLALFNVWAAFLGTLAMVSYAFVYTPMKRVSSVAVTLGAIPGAMPMLIGAVAWQGELTALAWTLFGIQFFWQFAHFWAIGYLGFDQYKLAGFNFIPEENGEPSPKLGLYAMWNALMLAPAGAICWWLGVTGMVSVVCLAVFGLALAWFAWRLYKQPARKMALQLMFASLMYLPLALTVLLLDKI
ncbi:MAG: protoheme IX farnesyltransferase [Bacteroidetes bacterium]|nr:protoheme IX farnesyltransferase [Bacteroidota bacterium]